jgi:hypothetical protein
MNESIPHHVAIQASVQLVQLGCSCEILQHKSSSKMLAVCHRHLPPNLAFQEAFSYL